MIIINYCKDGKAYSDFAILSDKFKEELIYLANKSREILLDISTENFILALRLLIVEDKIKPEQVIFKFKNDIFSIDEYGIFVNWPRGFIDWQSEFHRKIIKAQNIKRKRELNIKSMLDEFQCIKSDKLVCNDCGLCWFNKY